MTDELFQEKSSDWSERTVYRAYHGDIKRKEPASNKGRTMHGLSKGLYNYMLNRFHNKYSPDAIIGELRGKVDCICTKTLYNYINAGYFKELGIPPKRKKQKKRDVSWRNVTAKRITERPEGANIRKSGHWEMDRLLVVKRVCLCLLSDIPDMS